MVIVLEGDPHAGSRHGGQLAAQRDWRSGLGPDPLPLGRYPGLPSDFLDKPYWLVLSLSEPGCACHHQADQHGKE